MDIHVMHMTCKCMVCVCVYVCVCVCVRGGVGRAGEQLVVQGCRIRYYKFMVGGEQGGLGRDTQRECVE